MVLNSDIFVEITLKHCTTDPSGPFSKKKKTVNFLVTKGFELVSLQARVTFVMS